MNGTPARDRRGKSGEAIEPIGIVGRPDLARQRHDVEIDTTAAARAALNLQPRMPPPQLGEDEIEVADLAAPLIGAGLGLARLGPVAIVIPFQELDVVALQHIDYLKAYASGSIGALYALTNDTSLFARASRGGRFNADRRVLGGNFNADGSLNAQGNATAINFLDQQEVGLKQRGTFSLFGQPTAARPRRRCFTRRSLRIITTSPASATRRRTTIPTSPTNIVRSAWNSPATSRSAISGLRPT